MIYRKRVKLEDTIAHFDEQLDGVLPLELSQFFQFIEAQRAGKLGRAREAVRNQPASDNSEERKAA